MKLRAACLQMNSQDRMEDNIAQAHALVGRAREEGAELICLPENAFRMEAPGAARRPPVAESTHRGIEAAREWAEALQCWILVGSATVKAENERETRAFNRSLLISPSGRIAARYDKLHLFDVELPGGESYRESKNCAPGERAVLAETPWGGLGMTVCYDVRFPALYRLLAGQGASLLAVPAAFTQTTGRAHWHVLLRARAIENGCFVLAPAQAGTHPGGRKTYGHALIVNPWGEVIAEATGKEPCVVSAILDLREVEEARSRVPSLALEREFQVFRAAMT